MSKGEFSNLSGCGKPLRKQDNKNPYVDFTTHKINEVVIEFYGNSEDFAYIHYDRVQ